MTQSAIRHVTVGVALSVLDGAAALAEARRDLVAAGEAAPGSDAADVLPGEDVLAVLATLANPWRMADGAEATSLVLLREDRDHVLQVTFAVLDGDMAEASCRELLAAGGRAPATGGVADALRLVVAMRLDRDGIEAQDSFVEADDADDAFDLDGMLEDAELDGGRHLLAA